MRCSSVLLVLLMAVAAVASPGAGHGGEHEVRDGVLTLGGDPAADVRPVVPEEEPGPTYQPDGADLRALYFRVEEDNLTVRLAVQRPTLPIQAVAYTVVFRLGDRLHHVCWDARSLYTDAGTVHADGAPGLCGRIGQGERLGPSTTHGAILAAPAVNVTASGQGSAARLTIEWPIDATELANGLPRFVNDVRAYSWLPGAPPSTAWVDVARAPLVVADRAPDTGVWTADLGVLEGPRLVPGLPRLVLSPKGETGVGAVAYHGDEVTYRVHILTHDIGPTGRDHDFSVQVLGVPYDVAVEVAPANFTFGYRASETTVRITVDIGNGTPIAEYGHLLRLVVCHDAVDAPHHVEDPLPPNGCAERLLKLLVMEPAPPQAPAFQVPEAPAVVPDEKLLPAPGLAVSLLVVLALGAVLRRRGGRDGVTSTP